MFHHVRDSQTTKSLEGEKSPKQDMDMRQKSQKEEELKVLHNMRFLQRQKPDLGLDGVVLTYGSDDESMQHVSGLRQVFLHGASSCRSSNQGSTPANKFVSASQEENIVVDISLVGKDTQKDVDTQLGEQRHLRATPNTVSP